MVTQWRNFDKKSREAHSLECEMQEFKQERGAILAAHMPLLSYVLLTSSVPLLAEMLSPFKECLHFLRHSVFQKCLKLHFFFRKRISYGVVEQNTTYSNGGNFR